MYAIGEGSVLKGICTKKISRGADKKITENNNRVNVKDSAQKRYL